MLENGDVVTGVTTMTIGGHDVSAFVGKKTPEGSILDDDVQLCDWLVEVHKVAVVPGSGFGAPGFVRLSYATSMKNIQEGVSRIGKAFATLS